MQLIYIQIPFMSPENITCGRFFKWNIIFAFVIFSIDGFAQQLSYKHFKVTDGLSSSIVYDILKDHNGFLWFATDKGVCQFDGHTFKNLTTSEGLADNEILNIYEDDKNRIWFHSISGKLSYLENDSIHKFPVEYMGKPIYPHQVLSLPDGQLLLISKAIYYWKNGSVVKKLDISTTGIRSTAYLDKKGRIWLPSFFIKIIDPDGNQLNIDAPEFITEKVINVFKIGAYKDYTYYHTEKCFVIMNDKFEVVTYLKPSGLDNAEIITSLFDEAGVLWLGTSNGLFRVDNILTQPHIKHYFEGKIISKITSDNEGNSWISTLNDGVYMIVNTSIINYQTKDGLHDNRISALGWNLNENLIIGNETGGIDMMGNGKIKNIEQPQKKEYSEKVKKIVYVVKNEVWCAKNNGIDVLKSDGRIVSFGLSSIKAIDYDGMGRVYAAMHSGLYSISTKDYSIDTILSKTRIHTVKCISEKKQVFCDNEGIWYLEGKQKTRLKGEVGKLRAKEIEVGRGGTLFIATSGNGLWIYNNDRSWNINESTGLAGNNCSSLELVSDTLLLVGTAKGISFVLLKQSGTELKWKCTNINMKHGLISNEINDVLIDKANNVYVGTNDGLTLFPFSAIRNVERPVPVFITGLKILNRDTTLRDSYNLSYEENNIKIFFKALSFRNGRDMTYRYRLEGIDKEWTVSNSSIVEYYSLPPGSYKFMLSACNEYGAWNKDNESISIIIDKPYWETAWFRISVIAGIICLILVVFNNQVTKIKRRNKTEKRMVELEQLAIRAQMNPHFVFNAMNSIQQFILKNEKVSALNYLSKFGMLVRKVLEHSKDAMITIENECEMLELYLELESMRFEKHFEYNIIVDPGINPNEFKIPGMIIQPIVENAIWHGLMPLTEKGILTISFMLQEDNLICVVEDNGVGRNFHKSESKKHEPKGLLLIKERLELNAISPDKKGEVKIIDLDKGTKVELIIPIVNENEYT